MKLLCLGDSLTEGYEINLDVRWTNLLQKDLRIEIVNCGISGDTTSGMLARCECLLLKHQPTHIIIFGGTNDLWFGLKDEFILSNIHAMRRQSKYYDVIPIVGIPTPSVNLNELNMVHENYSECLRSFKSTLIEYCEEDEQPIIDFGLQMLPEHYLDDGLHPNEKGQKVMLKNAKLLLAKFM
jgi:acyl-CoA thioesterase-1